MLQLIFNSHPHSLKFNGVSQQLPPRTILSGTILAVTSMYHTKVHVVV